MVKSGPGEGQCQHQCFQGTQRLYSLLLTKSCVHKQAELNKNAISLTLREMTALSGQISVLGKELMVFMFNCGLLFFFK